MFAVFEFCIPLLGMVLGQSASESFADSMDWLGPALLALLGACAIFSAARSKQEAEQLASKVTTWPGLIALSAGLSVDNLIVGFSLGLGKVEPLVLATTIAAFSIAFALIGLGLGHRAQDKHRRLAGIATGLLLIALAGAVTAGILEFI